jgi:Recombination enhancement, RecA-dependent nuclease
MNKRQRRLDGLQQIGCIACRLDGRMNVASDIHHLVEGNKRLGDEFTIPLCPWHHRGVKQVFEGFWVGPSLAESKRDFVQHYGSERQLLEHVNELLMVGPLQIREIDYA